MLEDKLTVMEAAQRLQYHPGHIYRLLREGKLRGEKFSNTWIIDRKSVDEFKAQRDADSDPTNVLTFDTGG